MNWKRGFFRLAIAVAIVVLPPAGLYGWMQWRAEEQPEYLVIPGAKVVTRIPDARIISRSQIPMSPSINWAYAGPELAAAVLLFSVGVWWVAAGFRRK